MFCEELECALNSNPNSACNTGNLPPNKFSMIALKLVGVLPWALEIYPKYGYRLQILKVCNYLKYFFKYRGRKSHVQM